MGVAGVLQMGIESKETELKLEVPRERVAELQAHPAFRELLKTPARDETLVSVYFDSDNFDLRDHGVSLRVRHIGDRKIQTVKTAGQPDRYFERSEFEKEISGDLPDLGFAADSSLAPILTDAVRDGIKAVFETRIHRTAYQIGGDDWDVEMVLDEGQIVAGDASVPLSEIELELKRGDPDKLFKLASAINDIVPAQLSIRTKADRGYDLLEQRPLAAALAGDIALSAGLSAAQAFKAIGHACMRHIIANQTPVIARDPEAVHQLRIALRRLRVAISVFSDIVDDNRVAAIKSELKWFGRELAPARDLDVLMTEVLKPLRKQHPGEPGLLSLAKTFSRDRGKAYKRAQDAIGSDRFRKFVLDCAAWIEAGPWTVSVDMLAFRRRRLPAEIHAATQLSARRNKCRKMGRAIEELAPQQLHDLRIQFKKLRYTAEFFETLFTQKKQKKRSKQFLAALRKLQNSLGGLNDVTTRRALFADMMLRKERASARASGRQRAFAAGLIVGHQESQIEHLLRRSIKAYGKLEKIKPFWKIPASEPPRPDDNGGGISVPEAAVTEKTAL